MERVAYREREGKQGCLQVDELPVGSQKPGPPGHMEGWPCGYESGKLRPCRHGLIQLRGLYTSETSRGGGGKKRPEEKGGEKERERREEGQWKREGGWAREL